MKEQALAIVSKMIYEQNQILLQEVAKKYKLSEEELKRLFLTPTFHGIILSTNK